MAQYDFNYAFQQSILRLVAHDEGFLLQYRGALDPEWFSEPEHRVIARAALAVFDAGMSRPRLGSVLEAARGELEAGLDESDVADAARAIFDEGPPEDAEYIRKATIEFGSYQRVKAVLLDAEDMLEDGKLHSLVDMIREAAYVESAAAQEVYDYEDQFMDRIKTNRARLEHAVGTGLLSVDEHMEGGGLGAGEMGIVCALPGFGKTESLVNFGANALRQGKRVFHALVGDSPAHRVALRYDCNLSGQDLIQVRRDPAGAFRAVRKVLDESGGPGRLKIQWWPAKTITPQDLEDYLRWLEVRHSWRPDLLIIDYAANMKAEQSYGDVYRHEQGAIYKGVNALGGILKVPVWTAIQANRKDGTKIKTLTMEHFAEAFEPARDASVIITINMSEEEKIQGLIRYHFAKNRDGVTGKTITCECDFRKHTIRDEDSNVSVMVNAETGEIKDPKPPTKKKGPPPRKNR
jgi:hypothetical protein